MCARYTLRCGAEAIASLFGLEEVPELVPRYNIAPTQPVPGVVLDVRGSRVLRQYRWGLVPRWAEDPGVGQRMINARAESLAEKGAFREAFRSRRCLLPADGFFEWVEEETVREVASNPQGSLFGDETPRHLERTAVKQPYHIRRRDGAPFAFAGLWETWSRPDQPPIESCAIVTTEPNEIVRPLHDRMPAILTADRFDLWLDTDFHDFEALSAILGPCDPAPWEAVAVSALVGNPRNEDPRCVEPVG